MIYSLSNDTWNEEEYKAIETVIKSNKFTMAECVREYENEFAKKMGSKYAVMSNSGSSANLLMIAALLYSGKVKKGDEVLVTAVSWSTTYYPISQMGLKIRFVDIDKDTLNVDVNKIENAITSDTKVIMAVNLLGNPNDFDGILAICQKYNLILLEDNCESLGAMYNNKYAGTFGLIGSFSTYYSHHLCTMEGGMNVTDDEEMYHFMLSIRSHGWTRHLPENSKIYNKQTDSFYESFNFIMPGFNLRPIEMEAAVGIEQLKKMDKLISQRQQNAEYFKKVIKENTDFKIQCECGQSSWFGFALILPEEQQGTRRKYISRLMENQIEVRPIVAGNFVKQKALEYMDYSVYGELINADYIHDNGFFVGNHSIQMNNQIDYLIDVLHSVKIS